MRILIDVNKPPDICAISTGPHTHLDHLAPLCAALDIPLIVTQPQCEEIAQTFYPMVPIRYIPLQDLHLKALAKWDAIVTTGKFWAMELRPLLDLMEGKRVQFIFTPHGHSDKEAFLDHPIQQDIDLVYGPAMKRARSNPQAIEMGNMRYPFYLRHKAHFDALAAPFFRTHKPVILYAPTWASRACPTSFFDSIGQIIEPLAKDYHLLVKLHPLLEENHPALYHRSIARYRSQATFIEHFPAIYPLLDKSDIYLGDHSSIGYDFLLYDRPLYFLLHNGALTGALGKCGKQFKGQDVLGQQKDLSHTRRTCYQEVFRAPPLNKAELRTAILCRLQRLDTPPLRDR